jgi:hypothetical protein
LCYFLFVGNPDLIGITGIDGTGRLAVDLSGSAEWLMIPYSKAAPDDDTLYDVGGRLSYSVGGINFSVPLLPDTITVKPNPSLVVHYFHEKYVRGDDPLTPETEPIIPFTLAVMVMNTGYGVARVLKISSAQPEIIENEKGLLVSFKIIGAYFGNEPMTPSLSVEFGDIGSFETKTARWLLTSTLMGTFYNFSATFENINPLGDPQLSLFDELRYHELFHLVRIFTDDNNDDLDDFLVNDYVDSKGIPERLYNSANGSDVSDVIKSDVIHISHNPYRKSYAKTYTLVHLKVLTNTSRWFYTRIENNITSPYKKDNQHLLSAVTDNNREIMVDKNVWLTTHILDSFLIHFFDYIQDNSSETKEIEMSYFLIFGHRNMYPPMFNMTSYSATISMEMPIATAVLRIHAYDIDKDTFSFEIENSDNVAFSIGTQDGVILNKQSPLPLGETKFKVRVFDDGIPTLASTINVTIYVTSDEFATSSETSMSSANISTPSVISSESSRDVSTSSRSSQTVSDTSTPRKHFTSSEISTPSVISSESSRDVSTSSQTTSDIVTTSTEQISTEDNAVLAKTTISVRSGVSISKTRIEIILTVYILTLIYVYSF